MKVREAPSRNIQIGLHFITGQITSELPYQIAVGTLSYLCWYYPVGLYANAEPTHTVNQRGILMWMFLTSFYVYSATFGQLCMSFNELIDVAGNLASTLYIMCLMFCGVIVLPDVMPGFWMFMYRINPFTYLIQGILATGLGNNSVTCADRELLTLRPPQGLTCSSFLNPYIKVAGGYFYSLENGSCSFCMMDDTDQFLTAANSPYNRRWKHFGIFVAFIGINVICTIFLYWLFRVPKRVKFSRNKTIF